MRKKRGFGKKGQTHQEIVATPHSQSEKIRYGAPDGPRPKGSENYDGHTALESPGHEAMAQQLAVPKSQREFKSDKDMAKYFDVARMTLNRWKKNINVIKRAHWLAMQNKIEGELIARREFVPIVEKAVEMAKEGNIKAMEFCVNLAFPEDKQAIKSRISSLSLPEVLERAEIEYEKHAEMMTPTWLKERAARLASVHPPVAAGVSEPETKPEPVPVAVNACDSCGTTRCVHGRCPRCDNCEQCK
jgi:hypothetical protein